MAKSLKITVACGWAIPTGWLRQQVEVHFPGCDIHVLYPHRPANPAEAKNLLSKEISDIYIGYSLGSLWLLHHRDHLPQDATKAVIAPFLAFPKESGKGGKTALRQLKYLIRDLQRSKDIPSLLSDFLQWGVIPIPGEARKDIPDRDVLLEGLDFLEKISVPDISTENFIVILGDRDPFVDPIELKRRVEHLEILPDAGHAPEPLLAYLCRHPSLTKKFPILNGT